MNEAEENHTLPRQPGYIVIAMKGENSILVFMPMTPRR